MKTYRNKTTDGMTERHDSLLFIIDVQDKLMPAIANSENILRNIIRLIKACHIMGVPVIVTEQENLGNTVAEIKDHLPGKAIRKIHFNCFSCEYFSEQVKNTGRKTLILTGVEAHICVTQTALAALPFYNVMVVSDAVSSRLMDNKNIALQRLGDAGAVITSTEMFIYEILQKAGTDEFRSILSLVK